MRLAWSGPPGWMVRSSWPSTIVTIMLQSASNFDGGRYANYFNGLRSRRALPLRHSLFILIKNFARTRRGHPWLSLTGANRAFSRASAAASSNSVTSPTSTRRRFKASHAFCSNSSAAMRAAFVSHSLQSSGYGLARRRSRTWRSCSSCDSLLVIIILLPVVLGGGRVMACVACNTVALIQEPVLTSLHSGSTSNLPWAVRPSST